MLSYSNGSQSQDQQPPTIQTMRLRDEPPAITPPARSRKRKSPPDTSPDQHQQQQQPPPPPQPQPPQQVLQPPTIMHHPMQGQLHPGYQYTPVDYNSAPPIQQPQQPQDPNEQSPSATAPGGRPLSTSKRAEQNRKAQRAFRERRDQHVKALESRSQLLDAALASADEANRRWEECRALVDQLRVENAALRAALSQAQLIPAGISALQPPPPAATDEPNKSDEKDPDVKDQKDQ